MLDFSTLPECERCGERYDDNLAYIIGAPLVPTGFLIYDHSTGQDEWDADSCHRGDCPHRCKRATDDA